MQPDRVCHKDPKWCFWSGKLGWEGFPKSSWEWLKELKNTAKAAEQLDGTEIGDGDLIEKCIISGEVLGTERAQLPESVGTHSPERPKTKSPKRKGAKTPAQPEAQPHSSPQGSSVVKTLRSNILALSGRRPE